MVAFMNNYYFSPPNCNNPYYFQRAGSMTPECYKTQDYTMISKDLLSPQQLAPFVYIWRPGVPSLHTPASSISEWYPDPPDAAV